VAALRQALLDDPALLGRLLAELGERLPYTPILLIDQAEEVLTLAREKGDEAVRAAALEMLRQAAERAGRFKVVVALRTEYYGRFVDGLRRGVRPAHGVHEYLSSASKTQTTWAMWHTPHPVGRTVIGLESSSGRGAPQHGGLGRTHPPPRGTRFVRAAPAAK
jgi:hypothetical protein